MSFKRDVLFIGMILVIAIVLSLGMSCSNASPLHNNNRFKRNYVYEPLTTLSYSEYKSESTGGATSGPTSGSTSGPTSGSTSGPTSGSTSGPTSGPTISAETSAPAEGENSKEGFMNLLSVSSQVDSEKPIDIFSQTRGSMSCPSYGYYNSRGPLCLDKNQINILQTRGGNATGRSDEIGH